MTYSQRDYCLSKTVFFISKGFLGDHQDLTKTKILSGGTASFLCTMPLRALVQGGGANILQ